MYVADSNNMQIQGWIEEELIPRRTILTGTSFPNSFFVTARKDVYVDNAGESRIHRWAFNVTKNDTVMILNECCYGLFVSLNNSLYCSLYNLQQVISQSLNDDSARELKLVGGTGCFGSAPDMLYNPMGIVVDLNLNVYVADSYNDRIQCFRASHVNGTTVAGATALGTISLSRPTDVALDYDNYLFIVDSYNHRIVASGPNGFRCIAGCNGTPGNAPNQLNTPQRMSFDNHGNIFVIDRSNIRIQKFVLAPNPTSKYLYLF